MRIAIDASCLAVNRFSGLGEFAHNLLCHMPDLSPEIHFSLFINYFRPSSNIKDIRYSGTVNHFLKTPRRLIEFLWRFNWLPFDLYLREIDIFHAIHIDVPPTKKMKTILTIHDCRYLAFPMLYKSRQVQNYQRRMAASLERVDRVVAISEYTRQEVLKYFSFPEDRIKVIHYGFSPLSPDKNDYGRVKKFLADNMVKPPYLIFPGALDARKNFDRLIEAFAQCKKENNSFPQLVVAGIPSDHWIISNQAVKARELGVFDDILMCGVVDREIMTELIKNADVLCYPSLYEGFGIPPLEAMSLGIPVLAAQSSSIPEISGKGAFYVDPLDVNDISRGLSKLVSDTICRRKLIEEGYRQLKKFSWKRTSAQYLDLYKEVMER